MGKTIKKIPDSVLLSRPALTPEAEDNEMIALAIKQAKKQLREGTASSQIVNHFLQRGSPKARLEQKKLEKEIELMDAKIEALKSGEHISQLYENALNAMRSYSGHGDDDEDM